MPKKYGVKEKDLVVSHVINLVLTGKLRSGDRIDRNEIARQLGLSRVPVQEAVVQLEHDGILSTQYHRGAYVERFDAAVLREHHEVYGVLTGIASARAASDSSGKVLGALETHLTAMRSSRETRAFHDAAWRFRCTVNEEYAGPRLLALLQASQTFFPRESWTAYLNTDHTVELLPLYEAEAGAIQRGDTDGARAACLEQSAVMARVMAGELVRRGVLAPAPVAFEVR